MERYYRVVISRTGEYGENRVSVQLQSRALSTDYVTILSTVCSGMDRAQDIAQEWKENRAQCTDSAFEMVIDTRG